MMTPPLEKAVDLPARSPGALWGAAHLAWGVVIFLTLIYAVQQLPIDSTDWLKRLALLFFVASLAWIVLSGCRSVERGWRLRRPKVTGISLRAIDVLGDLLLGCGMLLALARGEQSRLLTAGLDRMVSAIAVVSFMSLGLSLLAWYALRGPSTPSMQHVALPWGRFAAAVLVVAIAAIIELSTF